MPSTALVRVHVPTPLREYSGGAREIELDARVVRDVFGAMERRYPALHRHLCDETGAVRRHIGVFVNRSHVSERQGLDTPLSPGDLVTILPAVSGG